LETLKINPDFMSFCSGSIEVGQRKFRCWFPAGHGWVDFYHAMAVSCNVYFYQLVHDTARFGLSSDQIAAMARNFGLGEKTGIGLSERAGTVPSRDYKLERYGEQWYEGDTLLFATGDMGLLEVTPMQMAMVTAAVANGGRLLRPHVIRELRWPAPDRRVIHTEPEVVRKLPVSDATWAKIRRGMYLAVNNPIGTGYHHVRFPGVTIAGKSGSAKGKQNEKSHAWFAAFAPYDHPRYACVVLVSRGGYGGVVAGPVVRRILQAAFAEESPAVVAERNRPKASG
jgi:penicillin-binding protein 2